MFSKNTKEDKFNKALHQTMLSVNQLMSDITAGFNKAVQQADSEIPANIIKNKAAIQKHLDKTIKELTEIKNKAKLKIETIEKTIEESKTTPTDKQKAKWAAEINQLIKDANDQKNKLVAETSKLVAKSIENPISKSILEKFNKDVKNLLQQLPDVSKEKAKQQANASKKKVYENELAELADQIGQQVNVIVTEVKNEAAQDSLNSLQEAKGFFNHYHSKVDQLVRARIENNVLLKSTIDKTKQLIFMLNEFIRNELVGPGQESKQAQPSNQQTGLHPSTYSGGYVPHEPSAPPVANSFDRPPPQNPAYSNAQIINNRNPQVAPKNDSMFQPQRQQGNNVNNVNNVNAPKQVQGKR